MQLLNVVRARSLWFLYPSDLNPRGKSVGEDLIEWLKESYNFSKAPSSPQDLDESKALLFTGGHFQIREEFFIDVELRIYNDGLIADTRSSTEDSDAFLKDALESAAREFHLSYSPQMVRRKLYTSELHVRTHAKLNDLNPKIADLTTKFAKMLGRDNIELAGLSLWTDTVMIQPQVPVQFRFERQLNVPFLENRYYSLAPLQTNQHLEILNDLEGMLAVSTPGHGSNPSERPDILAESPLRRRRP